MGLLGALAVNSSVGGIIPDALNCTNCTYERPSFCAVIHGMTGISPTKTWKTVHIVFFIPTIIGWGFFHGCDGGQGEVRKLVKTPSGVCLAVWWVHREWTSQGTAQPSGVLLCDVRFLSMVG